MGNDDHGRRHTGNICIHLVKPILQRNTRIITANTARAYFPAREDFPVKDWHHSGIALGTGSSFILYFIYLNVVSATEEGKSHSI